MYKRQSYIVNLSQKILVCKSALDSRSRQGPGWGSLPLPARCRKSLSLIHIYWNVNAAVHSLLIDGILTGVGSVLSFLPIIVTLFFFLSLLEDTCLLYTSRCV